MMLRQVDVEARESDPVKRQSVLVTAQAKVQQAIAPARLQATSVKAVTFAVAVWALLAIPGFSSAANVRATLSSTAAIGCAAVGMALVTLSGHYFMLSMGATAAVATIMFAGTMQHGATVAVLASLLVGAVAGGMQGIAIGVFRANPIIASIAAASIIRGVGAMNSGGLTVVAEGRATWLGVGSTFGYLPNQFLVFIVAAWVLAVWAHGARGGRELLLVGTNYTAARLAGLRVPRTVVKTYVLAGAMGGLAGVLIASPSGQGNLQMAGGLDFDAIAAVLVGGVAIQGGKGRVFDAAVGAIFLGLLTNVLLVRGLDFETQLLIKGVVVLLAVATGAFLQRWSQ